MPAFHSLTPRKCPPKDAATANGVYYRFVFNNPPTSDDFLIWILEPENAHRLEKLQKKGHCPSYAISMLTKAGASRSAGLFLRAMKEKARKRKSVFWGWAEVELDSDSGVISQTGRNPEHFDLWPYVPCSLETKVKSVTRI